MLNLAPAAPAAPAAAAPLRAWLAAAGEAFPERLAVLRCLVLAVVCPVPVNVLVTGPAGTAKSTLARALAKAIGTSALVRTLTPYSTDDDLLGAVDVAALQRGVLARCEAGSVADPAVGVRVHGWSSSSASGTVITLATSITALEATRKSALIKQREITLLAA